MEKELNYIDLIRTRHSTRNYEQHTLTETDRAQIMEAVAGTVPLSNTVHLAWKIADRSPMGCSGLVYAECGTPDEELVEYGYQGEQIVLALLAREWGTCWYARVRMPGSPCSITVGRPAAGGGPISGHEYFVTGTGAQVSGSAGHRRHPRKFVTTGAHCSRVCPPCPLRHEPPALELRSDIRYTNCHQE